MGTHTVERACMPRCWPDLARATLWSALAIFGAGAWPWRVAAETPPDITTCLGLADEVARLTCFDQQAGQQGMMRLPVPAAAQQPTSDSFLARYWELSDADKRGTFNYTAYRPNYFLPWRVMRSLNRHPDSPTRGVASDQPQYQHAESKLQLSIRTKVLERVPWLDADLWVAYTQQSMWQLWNQSASSPFRNSDFQPELIVVVPTPRGLRELPLGWTWQMAQLGLVHQSNGQAGALSRSWNRIYGLLGVERDAVTAQLRLEQRLRTSSHRGDDNPDIVHFMGRIEARVSWSPGRSTAMLLWRPARRGRGQVQLDWTYPVYNDRPDGLRWYVQVLDGFGETLLDYNFRQASLGLGLTLFKF